MNEEKSPFIKALEILLQGERTGQLINFVLIPLLVILAILLPPISLVDRVLSTGFTTITSSGGSVVDPDGTQLTILPEGLSQRIRVRLTSLPRLEFLAGKTEEREAMELIPPYLDMKSPLYLLEVRGLMPEASFLTIPIPNDAEPLATLDIYQWTGEEWQWLPHKIISEDDAIETWLSSLPRGIAVMQTRLRPPSVAAELDEGGTLIGAKSDILAMVTARGLFLQSDGLSGEATIGGEVTPLVQAGDYEVIPTLENRVNGVIRDDLTHNILVSEDLRRKHIQEIVALVAGNNYAGIGIDYAGIGLSLRGDFTAFITELAEQLHAQEKLLTVRVETPVQIAEDRWDTGGYDWEALGRAVDGLQLPALSLPQAYLPGGQMEALLNYAVGVVDRYKVRPTLSAQARDRVGDQEASLSYQEALGLLGSQIALPSEEVIPGQTLTMEPSSLRDWEMQYLEGAHTYWFTHQDERGEHTIFLENAESIAHKLELARAFNLQGVMVKGLLEEGSDERIWEALSQYAAGQPSTIETQFVILWQVTNTKGGVIAEEVCPLDDPTFSWTVPEAGEYTISYAISDDGGQTPSVMGGEALLVALAPTPTPTPTPTPLPVTPTPTPPPSTAPAPAKTPTPTPKPAPPPSVAQRMPSPGYGFNIWDVDKFPLVRGAGFNWIKIQLHWEWIEGAGKGIFDWSGMDYLVGAARDQGISILASVGASPSWATGGGLPHCPPSNFQDYGDFVYALVNRYKPGSPYGTIQAIEIWNEPNLSREWCDRPPNPREYVQLLQVGYQAAKRADPGVIVTTGGLTPTESWDPTAMPDTVFLEQMYQAGAKPYFDVLSAHGPGYKAPPEMSPDEVVAHGSEYGGHRFFCFRRVEDLRQIMVNYGDGGKQITLTEFGWTSDEVHPAYAWHKVSEEQKADYLVRAYNWAKQHWRPWIGVMFVWNITASGFGPDNEVYWWSVTEPDGTPRQAYNDLASMPK